MKFNNLRPMLETENLRETIKFYSELLGFKCVGLFPDAENPVWVCLQKDDVEIMFTLRNEHSIFTKPTMTGSVYINPEDVDEVWKHLKGKATIEYPIENFDYGMREFAIRDCNGYLVQFGQGIEEKT